MTESKPKRRWFRFSLRMLFVLITVICVVVNWKVVPAVQQRQAVSGLKDFAFVSYDYSYESVRTDDKGKPPPEPSWAARVIGVDSVHNAVQVSVSRRNDVHGRLSGLKHLPRLRDLNISDCRGLDDQDLEPICGLTRLERLCLVDDQLTDSALGCLRDLIRLRELYLYQNRLGDAGMSNLARLSSLEKLILFDNHIGDVGLAAVTNLSNLKDIDLSMNQITGEGLRHLANLTNLESLTLAKNQVAAGAETYCKIDESRRPDTR